MEFSQFLVCDSLEMIFPVIGAISKGPITKIAKISLPHWENQRPSKHLLSYFIRQNILNGLYLLVPTGTKLNVLKLASDNVFWTFFFLLQNAASQQNVTVSEKIECHQRFAKSDLFLFFCNTIFKTLSNQSWALQFRI